jgi:hypothetical protein
LAKHAEADVSGIAYFLFGCCLKVTYMAVIPL